MKKINTYGFNFNEEIKDYKDLCKNKEKRKYRTYLDWKKHIVENLEGMNIQSLENFRHLCLYQEKTENRGKEVFLPLSIALFSLYLTQFAIRDQDFFCSGNWIHFSSNSSYSISNFQLFLICFSKGFLS